MNKSFFDDDENLPDWLRNRTTPQKEEETIEEGEGEGEGEEEVLPNWVQSISPISTIVEETSEEILEINETSEEILEINETSEEAGIVSPALEQENYEPQANKFNMFDEKEFKRGHSQRNISDFKPNNPPVQNILNAVAKRVSTEGDRVKLHNLTSKISKPQGLDKKINFSSWNVESSGNYILPGTSARLIKGMLDTAYSFDHSNAGAAARVGQLLLEKATNNAILSQFISGEQTIQDLDLSMQAYNMMEQIVTANTDYTPETVTAANIVHAVETAFNDKGALKEAVEAYRTMVPKILAQVKLIQTDLDETKAESIASQIFLDDYETTAAILAENSELKDGDTLAHTVETQLARLQEAQEKNAKLETASQEYHRATDRLIELNAPLEENETLGQRVTNYVNLGAKQTEELETAKIAVESHKGAVSYLNNIEKPLSNQESLAGRIETYVAEIENLGKQISELENIDSEEAIAYLKQRGKALKDGESVKDRLVSTYEKLAELGQEIGKMKKTNSQVAEQYTLLFNEVEQLRAGTTNPDAPTPAIDTPTPIVDPTPNPIDNPAPIPANLDTLTNVYLAVTQARKAEGEINTFKGGVYQASTGLLNTANVRNSLDKQALSVSFLGYTDANTIDPANAAQLNQDAALLTATLHATTDYQEAQSIVEQARMAGYGIVIQADTEQLTDTLDAYTIVAGQVTANMGLPNARDQMSVGYTSAVSAFNNHLSDLSQIDQISISDGDLDAALYETVRAAQLGKAMNKGFRDGVKPIGHVIDQVAKPANVMDAYAANLAN